MMEMPRNWQSMSGELLLRSWRRINGGIPRLSYDEIEGVIDIRYPVTKLVILAQLIRVSITSSFVLFYM